jgi:hypothetical protein
MNKCRVAQIPGDRTPWRLTFVDPKYQHAFCLPSDTWNLEVAPTFVQNLCNPYKLNLNGVEWYGCLVLNCRIGK